MPSKPGSGADCRADDSIWSDGDLKCFPFADPSVRICGRHFGSGLQIQAHWPRNGRSPALPFQDARASMVRAARDGDRSHATNSETVSALEIPMRRHNRGGSKIAAKCMKRLKVHNVLGRPLCCKTHCWSFATTDRPNLGNSEASSPQAATSGWTTGA